MKRLTNCIRLAVALCVAPTIAHTQSSIEFESGTHIEVTAGADICADNITINGTYSGSGTQCGGALPVEMVGLKAEVSPSTSLGTGGQRSEVRLSWTTASEVDNAGWEVERRSVSRQSTVDSRQTEASGWVKLGFVEGAGTSSSAKTYAFVDNPQSTIRNPQSRYAYRLKQLDRSGSFSYSHEAEVELGLAPRELTLGQNYPNPFNPTTLVPFTLSRSGHASLRLYDLLGREVATLFEGEAPAGRIIEVVFDAGRLSSGTYVYRLSSGGRSVHRSLTVLK